MRLFTFLLLIQLIPLFSKAQSAVSQRVADLQRQNYTIQGDAILTQFDDGSITLSLSEDFTTPRGPDVRIFLGNSLSITGAVEIVDLSDINHFSGALTVDVPAEVVLEQYDFVIFYCFAFRALWASGELGAVMMIGEELMCPDNNVQLAGGATSIALCPEDGIDDNLVLKNNLFLPSGEHYAYLLTDTNEILQAVIFDSLYNFEGSSLQVQRIYGINYDGTLSPRVGQHRTATTADGDCFIHSSSDLFLTIKKTACPPIYECQESATATTDWVDEVAICPGDGVDDIIVLKNNLLLAPGEHYAYLMTDTNEILQAVIFDSLYNFEGSGLEAHRIYGINYDGTLNPMIGQHRTATTADACYQHSSSDLFLTIKKEACPSYECQESLTATHAWVTEVDICSNDGEPDHVFLQNNLFIAPGDNYIFLLTDANEILQEVITDTSYNFEGTGIAEQRVYGLNYAGELRPKIGAHRRNTTASECHIHSGDNLFIRLNKTAACATSTFNETLAKQIALYPNPVKSLLQVRLPDSFVPEQMEVFDLLGSQKQVSIQSGSHQLELDVSRLGAGTYLLRMSDEKEFVTVKFVLSK